MRLLSIALPAIYLSGEVNSFTHLTSSAKIQKLQLSATPESRLEEPHFGSLSTISEQNQYESEIPEEYTIPLTTTETIHEVVKGNPSSLNVEVLGPIFCVSLLVVFLAGILMKSSGVGVGFLKMDLPHKVTALQELSWLPGTITEPEVVVGLVMAFSAFAQALTGFGFAVVAVGAMSSMPWLLHSELYDVITPVTATLGSLVGFCLLLPYAFEENGGLEWEEILPLLVPCTILTPLGIQLSNIVDPLVATRVLAALIMGFVAYKLVPTVKEFMTKKNESLPEKETPESSGPAFLQSKAAAIVFGSAAGIFGGAFDVQGPPLCIYGDAKGWTPAQFRNNLLAVVALNSALVVGIDYYQGVLEKSFYYSYFCLTSLPGVLVGLYLGQEASKRIDPVLFKNLVLLMCMGLGVQLLTIS